MVLILIATGLLLVSGFSVLFIKKPFRAVNYIGAFGAVSACCIGLFSLLRYFFSGCALSFLTVAWPIPYGSFSIALDSLSAFFLCPVFIVSGLCALYALDYLNHYEGKKNIAGAWFFFNLLLASMVFIVTARNVVLFLAAWEMMSIASFFLVMFEGEREEVRRAGLIYFIASHIGTSFLLAMFLLLVSVGGSFDLSQMKVVSDGAVVSFIFLFALIGFGTKAGFMPMHVWLPEAHPAAPSHVSAVMSGVMIKMGIYGLLRILMILNTPLIWWGWLLIAIGAISGVFGILFALAQKDLKRLLAYSSIENIGIITMAMGMGILGASTGQFILMFFGFGGCLLHVLNHAFFKGLLFLGAGAVLQETGTRNMDILGGLLKKMPVTGFCFLAGSAAICGLPPLNGFIGEFLIYSGAFKNIFGSSDFVFSSLVVITSLSFIGALAVACFTKAFGTVFLGQARSSFAHAASEAGIFSRIAMLSLVGLCFLVVLLGPLLLFFLRAVLADLTGFAPFVIDGTLSQAFMPLGYITAMSVFLCLSLLLVACLRGVLLKRRVIERASTWDCGYIRSVGRAQYSASSFTQPVVEFFKGILRPQKQDLTLKDYFPSDASFGTQTGDLFHGVFYRHLHKLICYLAKRFTWFQHGRLQLYILYILVTLLILLLWKL